MGGAFIGTGGQICALIGIELIKRINVMYSYETSGKYNRYIGPSHEIALSYDIIELSYVELNRECIERSNGKTKMKRILTIKKAKTK